MDMLRGKKKVIIIRVVSDVVIIGAGGIVLLLFRFFLSPYKRGFFCDDQSLMYPFKESTVPSGIMYTVGFILACTLMCAVESIKVYKSKHYELRSTESNAALPPLWILIRNVYLAFVPFVYGAVIEHIVTDIGKYGVGRLRPHFFDVCKVDFTTVDCSSGLSFPSGHSSFSSYVAAYLMIYIQRRATFCVKSLIRPFTQAVVFCAALYICISRISDYKHHPTDVMGGAFIGIIVAGLFAYNVSDLFSGQKHGNTDTRIERPSLDETPRTSAF